MSSDCIGDSSFLLSAVNVKILDRSSSGTVYLKHIISQWTQLQSKLHAVLHKESFGSRLAGCGGITRITDHAPIGSLSWLYPLYEFQNGWYICSQMSILNMCNHLEYICPRVPGDITDPMVPISSSYIGLFQAKSSKKMGAHHTGDWPAGPPT